MKYLRFLPMAMLVTLMIWGVVSAQEPPKGPGNEIKQPLPPKNPGGPGHPMEPGKGPGGPGGPGQPGQNRPVPQLSEEERKQVLDFLKEFSPERMDHLSKLEKRNPSEYNDILAKSYRQMRELTELKKTNPDIYDEIIKRNKFENQSMELAKQYRETEDAKKKEELKTQLQAMLADLFDLREKEKEREIKKLETQLNELKNMYQKRKENKNTIIEDRLKELLGDKETMKW